MNLQAKRQKAITVIELLKGHTPEQREKWDNATRTCEELAFDILELTNPTEIEVLEYLKKFDA